MSLPAFLFFHSAEFHSQALKDETMPTRITCRTACRVCCLLLAIIVWAGVACGAEMAGLAIAHRGFCLEAPENTMPAFRAALAAGYGFELDVYASQDGMPVVIHDRTVDRTTNGTGAVSQRTLAELRELDAGSWFDPRFAGARIPTLNEVLELVAAQSEANVEVALHLKQWDPPLLKSVLALVAKHGLYQRTFTFGPPTEVSRRIKQLEPRMRTVWADATDSRNFSTPDGWQEALGEDQCDGVWVHFIPTAEQMQLARELEKPVYFYTSRDDPDAWRRAAALGVVTCLNDVRAWAKAGASRTSTEIGRQKMPQLFDRPSGDRYSRRCCALVVGASFSTRPTNRELRCESGTVPAAVVERRRKALHLVRHCRWSLLPDGTRRPMTRRPRLFSS